jgi:hypothetical protein
MLSEFRQRSRATQRSILAEVGQLELAIERDNPRKPPEIVRESPNKLAKILILCAAIIIIILIGVNWFLLHSP